MCGAGGGGGARVRSPFPSQPLGSRAGAAPPPRCDVAVPAPSPRDSLVPAPAPPLTAWAAPGKSLEPSENLGSPVYNAGVQALRQSPRSVVGRRTAAGRGSRIVGAGGFSEGSLSGGCVRC